MAQELQSTGLHIFVSLKQLSSTCHVSFLAAPDTDHKHRFFLTHFIHFAFLSDGLTFTNKPYDSRPFCTLRCSTAEWRINTNAISHKSRSTLSAFRPKTFTPHPRRAMSHTLQNLTPRTGTPSSPFPESVFQQSEQPCRDQRPQQSGALTELPPLTKKEIGSGHQKARAQEVPIVHTARSSRTDDLPPFCEFHQRGQCGPGMNCSFVHLNKDDPSPSPKRQPKSDNIKDSDMTAQATA